MERTDPITTLKGIGPKKAEQLRAAGLETLEDLIQFFPRKYEDRRNPTAIQALKPGSDALVQGIILQKKVPSVRFRKAPLSLVVDDGTGRIEVVFFNGRFLSDHLQTNEEYVFYGRVSENLNRLQMIHPEFALSGSPEDVRGILPHYPQISGISQKEMRRLQRELMPLYDQMEEWLPADIVQAHRLASPSYAVSHIHFPQTGKQVLEGKYRLVFDELLTLETGLLYIKTGVQEPGAGLVIDCSPVEAFRQDLPFSLTEGQEQAWADIRRDLESDRSMNRLIQGDVGSGKTVLAELAMYAAAKNGYQSVLMAPTELLAKQHSQLLQKDFDARGIRSGLLCSSMKSSEKKAVLEQLADGTIQVLAATHAVLQESVTFRNLALAITDEQHRFGVSQRRRLSEKGKNPNIMVMTATPIPRTLAVVLYGDLDISQIRTMPKGRMPIRTVAGTKADRDRIYEQVREEIQAGRQAYVVAPLIEESETIEAVSAEELLEEMKVRFAPEPVALIHGAMKQDEKDAVMTAFAGGATRVLVSTVVIEVGIHVPNATVMVIENAERFGLAQLHQLRGRVGRGTVQSYCYLIQEKETELSQKRCQCMVETTDGFQIAEDDLKMRGPGELFGTRQHGIPSLQLADLVRHIDILEQAKDTAKAIVGEDPTLSEVRYAPLRKRIEKLFGEAIRLEL